MARFVDVSRILPERCEDRQQSCSLSRWCDPRSSGSPRPARQLADLAAKENDGQFYGNSVCNRDATDRRARVLVQGAFDLHIHVAPDVPPRRIDDVTLAHRFGELGLAGFALKSHYPSTARGRASSRASCWAWFSRRRGDEPGPRWDERARRQGSPRARARGSCGCRRSTPRRRPRGERSRRGQELPQWARLQHQLRELGLGVEPVEVTGADGVLLAETRDVLRDRAPRAILATVMAETTRSRSSTAHWKRVSPRSSSRTPSSRAGISRSTISASSPPAAACSAAVSPRRYPARRRPGARLRRHPCRRWNGRSSRATAESGVPARGGRACTLGRSAQAVRGGRDQRDDRRAVASPRRSRLVSRRL